MINQLINNPKRSLLFVPGNRPERFSKALQSGADMICIDLEDAVPMAEKASARAHALAFAADFASASSGMASNQLLVIRCNALRTEFGQQDLQAIAQLENISFLIMFAKQDDPLSLQQAAARLTGKHIGLIPLLESAHGIEAAFQLAAVPGVVMMMLGGADYCAELGAVMGKDSLLYPRSRLAAACAAYGLCAIDVPFLAIADGAGLSAETRYIAALGLACKSAIHPNQIATIHQAMQPSAEAIVQAERVLQAAQVTGRDANAEQALVVVDGKMVDRPIILAAKQVLARANAAFAREPS